MDDQLMNTLRYLRLRGLLAHWDEYLSLAQGEAPNAIDPPGLAVKSDGNNVSMDREARLLAENALRFNVASNLMKTQLKMLQSAIKEGQSS